MTYLRKCQYIISLSTNLQQLTMPYIPHTPESLLARSDSKNPASTCRGLTSNGKPCRRSISRSSPYCWQHKDQTPQIQPTIKERTSTDTLVDRLGILEISPRKQERKRERQKQKPSNLALFCCIGEASETRAARPARPPINRDPPSRTKEFLSLIPKSTSPQITALLLTELAKPVSDSDDPGFIYIFWLTPETSPAPTETAQSLLKPPQSRPQPGRRTSEVISTFANEKKTILLKIGRAANVQRRLNQWTRQCGYNLSIVRYYPYQSASSTSVNEVLKSPRKVPNAHKVERLIHIELGGKRAQGSGKCGACNREHREWFEVEASRAGVKAVDEVVKRWVAWGERTGRK